MLFYSIIFAIIILLYFLLNVKEYKNSKKIYFYLISFLLIIIACLRNKTVGNDVQNYVNFFSLVDKTNFIYYIDNGIFEPFYILLNYSIKMISFDYHLFLIVVALLIYIPIFKFLKNKSDNYLISFSIFYGFLFYFESMSGLRQYIAISFILLSLKYIKNKKIIKFFAFIIMASLFHKSAIVCLILYPLYYMKNYGFKNICLITATIMAFTLFYNYLTSFLISTNIYSSYIDRVGDIHIASILGTIINFCMFVIIKICLKKEDSFNNLYINCSLVAFLLSIMSIKFNIIGRMSLYFEIFSLISLANSIESIEDSKMKLLCKYGIVCLAIAYFGVIMYLRSDWYDVVPYILMG